jgi:peroxiredoxin
MRKTVSRVALASLMLAGAFFVSAAQSAQRAPELVGSTWLNTEGRALKLAELRGKVTIVHFWTFACSNCKANLAAYSRWHDKYAKQGVTVIGVHTPETESERVEANVRDRVEKYGIKYPVLIDGEGRNWNAWKLRYWPTVFLVDKKGKIRGVWEGELEWQGAGGEAKMAAAIEQLLAE